MTYLIITAVIILFIAVLIPILVMRMRKRSAAIKNMASRMGFSFTQNPDRKMLDALAQSFELFNKGSHGEFRNFLEGSADGRHVSLFDYSYSTISDSYETSTTKTYVHTAAVIDLKGKELPRFQLGHEGLRKKIKGLVGTRDIKIGHDEEFSRRFWLTGADNAAIEAIFNPEITSYFRREADKNTAVESDGSRILYYQVGRVDPKGLQDFLNRTEEMARLFYGLAER
ncbi:MAG: hypothetical protein ACYC4M_04575 [Thermoleophilia bacterium]